MPTPLPRPGPTDYQDAPGTELDLVWDELCDVVEATEATANAALPATQAAAGTLIAAAADKATPADADSLALSDSAAGGILRRFSWASLKAALNGVFARLAGVSGGQTLIGGTASGENLTLQSTAHATRGKLLLGTSAYDEAANCLGIGTLTPSAKMHAVATTEQLRLGYDASNYSSETVSSTGTLTIAPTGGTVSIKGGSGIATLSSSLVTNGGFTSSLSGWTDSGSSWSWSAGTALHTAGSASTLSQAFATTSGTLYVVRFTLTRTAGSVTVTLGGDVVYNSGITTTFTSSATYKRGLVASAGSSAGLVFDPSSDFAGSIDYVEIYAVTVGSFAAHLKLSDSADTTGTEFRVSGVSPYNVAIGNTSLRSAVDAAGMTVIGSDAGRTVIGGVSSLLAGYAAGYLSANPIYSTFVGAFAGYGLKTPASVVAVGYFAARYIADGSTTYTLSANSVYVGASTKASADAVTNENVFGYAAVGIGSNSCVLGSSAVTKCQIFGDIILNKTVTAGGTTGAQTINKTVGSVNFAAGATSLVVTNNRVTTASIIVATVATADATMKSVVAVAAAGSFTLTANAAATAETRVNFIVIN